MLKPSASDSIGFQSLLSKASSMGTSPNLGSQANQVGDVNAVHAVNQDIWQHKQRWISLASSSFSMTAIFFSFCSCPWNHLTVNHAQTSHCRIPGGFWFRDQSPAECNSARWSCRRLKTRSKLWPQQDRNPSTGLSSHPALRSDADGRARPELVQIYPQHGTSQDKHKRISFSVSDWPYL